MADAKASAFFSPVAEEALRKLLALRSTGAELRYNITEQLQFAFGANNLFNIRPDTQPFAQNGALTSSVTALNGNNVATGVAIPGGNGNVNNNYFGTAWNPNGGYYYGRIQFNF